MFIRYLLVPVKGKTYEWNSIKVKNVLIGKQLIFYQQSLKQMKNV